MDTAARAAVYAAAFDRLDAAAVEDLRQLVVPEVRFVDPFNDVTGVERYLAVFHRAVAELDELRFVTRRVAVDGEVAFLRWTMTARPRGRWLGERLVIEGVSEIAFDAEGRATSHVDHWDAAGQLYERVPLLGGLLRQLRLRLAVGG